ncbi:MAG: cold-shock protein [Phycisphaerales bacterium]|nr:cold-shock protein [Phycisphaerae bacterium]NNF44540.1 cold-shock protein [Phycisphaerales bacterium]NNM26014.1 cold-shock protein [Phycisphaerales bacterium]
MEGNVKWFDKTRGFGFIEPDDGSADVFVHSTAIDGRERSLRQGDRVVFELVQSDKGPKAASVRNAMKETETSA